MLRPRGTGRILNRLKKLTGHFVHTEPLIFLRRSHGTVES